MPVVITIQEDKYFNGLRNGLDFASNTGDFSANLQGNVMEPSRKSTTFEIEWYAQASVSNLFSFDNGLVLRDVGSFLDDGFKLGDVFDWVDVRGSSPTVIFTGEITFISTSGQGFQYTVESGTAPSGAQDTGVFWARADRNENYLTALVYKFGLNENQVPVTFNNEASLTEQRYYGQGIGSGSPRATTFVDLTVQGSVNDFVTGSAKARFVSNDTYHQVFEVVHEFVVNPWYLDGELDNLQNRVNPDRLLGSATLKYVFETDFRKTLTDPNTGKVVDYNSALGSVGWFDENGNGFASDYNVLSVAYTDTATAAVVQGLQIDSKTTVTIVIEKLSGAFASGSFALGSVSFLPLSQDYQGTTTTMLDNFLYDVARIEEGTGATTGSGIIKSIQSSLSGSNLLLTMDIEYTQTQAETVTGGNYIVAVQVEDSTTTAQASDRVMLLADVNEYTQVDAVALSATWTDFKLVQHPNEALTGVFESSIAGWNNDGIVIEFFFDVDLNRSTVVNTVTIQVVAYDTVTGSDFLLDSYEIDISSTLTSGGIQQLDVTGTRGYFLTDSDQFNWVRLRVGANAAGVQSYFGAIGQKIPWQEWIRNLDADTDFISSTEPNQGLNYKSSNYSRIDDYEIRAKGVLNTTSINAIGQTVTGDVTGISSEVIVSDYAKDKLNNPVKWTQIIQLFDPDTMQDLGTNILSDRPVLMKVTHVPSGVSVTDVNTVYCIHKMEVFDDRSSQINELSSMRAYPSGNYLVPLSGETLLKVYLDGLNVISECLIDNNALSSGVSKYNLYARIDFK